MEALRLNKNEKMELETVLSKMEKQFGTDYSFKPKKTDFSCGCSGPAQSCIWH